MAVVSTTYAKSLASKPKPKREATISGPMDAQIIESHGKVSTVIPKPIVQYYNLGRDFHKFKISIVERGLYLEIVPKYEETEAGVTQLRGSTEYARPTDGGINSDSDSRALDFSAVEGFAA